MACDLTKGRLRGCRGTIPGTKAAYFVNYDPTQTFTVVSEEITAVSVAQTIFRYDFDPGHANFDENLVVNEENNSVFWEQVLAIDLFGMTKEDKAELKLMTQASMHVYVEQWTGDIMLMGKVTGTLVNGGSLNGGRNAGDFVGAKINFVAREECPATHVENTGALPFDNVTNLTPQAGT